MDKQSFTHRCYKNLRIKLPCNADNKKISSSSLPSNSWWFRCRRCFTTTSSGNTMLRQSGHVARSCCSHVSTQSLWNVWLHFLNFLISSPSSYTDRQTAHSSDSILNPVLYRQAGFFLSTSLRYWVVVMGRFLEPGMVPTTARTRITSSRNRREKKTMAAV